MELSKEFLTCYRMPISAVVVLANARGSRTVAFMLAAMVVFVVSYWKGRRSRQCREQRSLYIPASRCDYDLGCPIKAASERLVLSTCRYTQAVFAHHENARMVLASLNLLIFTDCNVWTG